MKIFEFLAKIVNGVEKGLIDLLSALVPYAVPAIPAYLSYYHTKDMMDFPSWVAFTAAFVVETLGLASVSTTIKFWRNNQRYKSEQNKAPFWLALFTYIFYIIIVMTVNVILEVVAGTRSGWIIVSIGLFTLMSVPSGILIAIRTQYQEMLEERSQPRVVPSRGIVATRQRHASDFKEQIATLLETEYAKSGQVLSPKAITAQLKLDHAKNKGFVSTFTSQWKAGKVTNTNHFTIGSD